MASQTVTRLYDIHADAVEVVQQLEAGGVPHSDIGLVSNDAEALSTATCARWAPPPA